jgi:hypothetical protein
MVVAEVGLAGSGRDDQAVERRHVGVTEEFGPDGLGLQVDSGHVAE